MRACSFVIRGGDYRDSKAEYVLGVPIGGLREIVCYDAERIVSHSVRLTPWRPRVLGARKSYVDEPVEEFVHTLSAEGLPGDRASPTPGLEEVDVEAMAWVASRPVILASLSAMSSIFFLSLTEPKPRDDDL